MKTEKKWWFKLFCILFFSISVFALGFNWFLSTLQRHQWLENQWQQSLPMPHTAFFSQEPLAVFLSNLTLTFSASFFISIIIFFFVYIYLKSFVKANFFLLKSFSSALDSKTRKEVLATVVHSSNSVLHSIQEGLVSVLQESSQEQKKPPSANKESLFSELVSEICQKSAHFYPFLSIHAQIDRDLTLPVFSSSLLQALWELVKNAAEAMGSGQSYRQLAEFHIHSYHQGPWFCCELEDNGPGMSEREISQACELYFSTKTASSGLGLSVVQSVLSRIGGIMKLSSSKKFNNGLKVSLFIPLDYMEHVQDLKKIDQKKKYPSEVVQI